MANLEMTIQAIHRDRVANQQVNTRQSRREVSGSTNTDRLDVTESASVDVPLGEVATPVAFYIYNTDENNPVLVLDDATEIGRVPALQQGFFWLPDGVDLKMQAINEDVEVDFAVFGAA